jgi:hypothetical protein
MAWETRSSQRLRLSRTTTRWRTIRWLPDAASAIREADLSGTNSPSCFGQLALLSALYPESLLWKNKNGRMIGGKYAMIPSSKASGLKQVVDGYYKNP